MMDEKSARFAMPAGTTSLIMIFAVLCLTVFAIITLSTAQREMKLAQASAQAVSDYYSADSLAEEMTLEIGQQLAAGNLPSQLGQTTIHSFVDEAGTHLRFLCPIDEAQALDISLFWAGDELSVLRWQVTDTQAWQPDDSIPVWSGD